ncbi:hypothetical protein AAU61_01050 [Desulfocarbo indianensis]|nr:hypothetical protein AAU61_01050 [Desulfocarbo indianensis]
MECKASCQAGAASVSFFHTRKMEMSRGESAAAREAIHRAVFQLTRRHSANGYISPLAFENKMAANDLSVVTGQDQRRCLL